MKWINILDNKEKNIIVGEHVFVMFYFGYIREVEVAVYASDKWRIKMNVHIRECGCADGLLFCIECATHDEKIKFGLPPALPEAYFIAHLNLSCEENLERFKKYVSIKKSYLEKLSTQK